MGQGDPSPSAQARDNPTASTRSCRGKPRTAIGSATRPTALGRRNFGNLSGIRPVFRGREAGKVTYYYLCVGYWIGQEVRAMKGHMLDQGILDDVVRRIVEVAQPEKIILFGSAASGRMGPHSDIDLLIVKEGAQRRTLAGRIYDNLHGAGVAVDVIVVTPADIERYKDSHALVIKPALKEGKVVYESA